MTLDELIDLAMEHRKGATAQLAGRLATGVIDLFAEAQPCGFDAPTVQDNGSVGIPNEWAHGWLDPEEARALGRMLFRAADEADALYNRPVDAKFDTGGEG